jgi:hypothetical protein
MSSAVPLRVHIPELRDRVRALLASKGRKRDLAGLDRFTLAVLRYCEVSVAALRLPVPEPLQARATETPFVTLVEPIRALLDADVDPAVDELIEVLDRAGELSALVDGSGRSAAVSALRSALCSVGRSDA